MNDKILQVGDTIRLKTTIIEYHNGEYPDQEMGSAGDIGKVEDILQDPHAFYPFLIETERHPGKPFWVKREEIE